MGRTVRIVASFLGVLTICAACGSTSSSSSPSAPSDAVVVRITVTPSGCQPVPAHVPAGVVEVIAKNLDAPTVSEVEVRSSNLAQVLGEKENLIQGMSSKFSISLKKGSFVVNCPGAAQAHWTLSASTANKKGPA